MIIISVYSEKVCNILSLSSSLSYRPDWGGGYDWVFPTILIGWKMNYLFAFMIGDNSKLWCLRIVYSLNYFLLWVGDRLGGVCILVLGYMMWCEYSSIHSFMVSSNASSQSYTSLQSSVDTWRTSFQWVLIPRIHRGLLAKCVCSIIIIIIKFSFINHIE